MTVVFLLFDQKINYKKKWATFYSIVWSTAHDLPKTYKTTQEKENSGSMLEASTKKVSYVTLAKPLSRLLAPTKFFRPQPSFCPRWNDSMNTLSKLPGFYYTFGGVIMKIFGLVTYFYKCLVIPNVCKSLNWTCKRLIMNCSYYPCYDQTQA